MNSKSIYMLDMNNFNVLNSFINASDAAKNVNGQSGHILRCAKGIRLSAYGFRWVFAELWDNDEKYKNKIIYLYNIKQSPKRLPVVLVKISNMKVFGEFDNISCARRELGLSIRSSHVTNDGFDLVDQGKYAVVDKQKWKNNRESLTKLIRSYDTINYNDAKAIMDIVLGNRYGCIYKATNIKNGKIYIGQTTRELKKRVKQHFRDAIMTPSSIFHHALRKYGSKGFSWEVVDFANNQEELDKKEIEWINKLDSTNVNIGYNSTYGGEGGKPTEELKQKMSNIITDLKGQKVYKIDKKTYEIVNIYNSIAEAAQDVSANPSSISNCLNGNKYSSKGYKWALAEKWDNDIEYQNLIKIRINKNLQKENAAAVYKLNPITYEIISKFNSLADAARDVDTTHISISACANGKTLKIKGFKWVFSEKWDNDPKYRDYIIKRKNENSKSVYQLDKDTFEIINKFEHAIDAALAFDISKASISGCAKGKNATIAGYRWVDCELWDSDEEYQKLIKNISYEKKLKKPVLQIDPNSNSVIGEFSSIRSASKSLGISLSGIKSVLHGIEKTASGFKWVYKHTFHNDFEKVQIKIDK